jgi:hypothetical protein
MSPSHIFTRRLSYLIKAQTYTDLPFLSTSTNEKKPTIQQLINKHKIILNSLLVKLIEISLPEPLQPLQKLKHQRGIGIALRDRYQVYVLVADVREGGGAEGEDGRAHVDVRNDLDTEYVCEARATVGAEGAED